jgi:hypothetical protein
MFAQKLVNRLAASQESIVIIELHKLPGRQPLAHVDCDFYEPTKALEAPAEGA